MRAGSGPVEPAAGRAVAAVSAASRAASAVASAAASSARTPTSRSFGAGAVGRLQPQPGEQLEVELGRHGDQRRGDAGGGAHGLADLHERHRVAVGAAAHLDVVGHATRRAARTRRADAGGGVVPRGRADGQQAGERRRDRPGADEGLEQREDGRRGPALGGVREQVGRQGGRRLRAGPSGAADGRPSWAQVTSAPASTSSPAGVSAGAEAEQRVGGVREALAGPQRLAPSTAVPSLQPAGDLARCAALARRRAAPRAPPPRPAAAHPSCARAAPRCGRGGSGRRRARAPRRRPPPGSPCVGGERRRAVGGERRRAVGGERRRAVGGERRRPTACRDDERVRQAEPVARDDRHDTS